MEITLEPVGLLKRYCQESLNTNDQIILGKDTVGRSLEAVCQEVGLPPKMISLYIVNDQIHKKDYRLQAGDHIKCVAIIGGG